MMRVDTGTRKLCSLCRRRDRDFLQPAIDDQSPAV